MCWYLRNWARYLPDLLRIPSLYISLLLQIFFYTYCLILRIKYLFFVWYFLSILFLLYLSKKYSLYSMLSLFFSKIWFYQDFIYVFSFLLRQMSTLSASLFFSRFFSSFLVCFFDYSLYLWIDFFSKIFLLVVRFREFPRFVPILKK